MKYCPECKRKMNKAGTSSWLKAGEVKTTQKYICTNKACKNYLRVGTYPNIKEEV